MTADQTQVSTPYCCTQHFYEVLAGERFFDLVVEKYHSDRHGDGIFPPQNVSWLTVRDGDIGYAVGVLMTALRHRADHVEWIEYLAKTEVNADHDIPPGQCGVAVCTAPATHKSGMLVTCWGHAEAREAENGCKPVRLATSVPALTTDGSLG